MYERTYTSKVLAQNESQEKKKKRRRLRLPRKKVLWIVFACVFVGGVFFLIRLPGLQITTVEVGGTRVADPQEVELFVRSHIEGQIVGLLPRSSMLLVPTSIISKKVLAQFPRFASVDIRRSGVRGLTVMVVEHEGAFLWCDESEECLFMTAGGVVFAPAPFFSGDAYEKIYYGEAREIPFSPLPSRELGLVQLLRERLPSVGIVPTEYRFVSEHGLDVVFAHDGARARIMFDQTGDINKTLEDLATALATEPLKTRFITEGAKLEYLDARFANKVVYKFGQ